MYFKYVLECKETEEGGFGEGGAGIQRERKSIKILVLRGNLTKKAEIMRRKYKLLYLVVFKSGCEVTGGRATVFGGIQVSTGFIGSEILFTK